MHSRIILWTNPKNNSTTPPTTQLCFPKAQTGWMPPKAKHLGRCKGQVPTALLFMAVSTKVEAEHNNDLHLHLCWDMTGRFQVAQELQGSLAVLVGQGDHFCLELQENPAKTHTEQIQMLSLASKDIEEQIFPFLTKSV